MALQLKKGSNFEIKDNCENEPRFDGVYSRDNLPKIIKCNMHM